MSLAERRKICGRLGQRYYPAAMRRDRLLEEAIAGRLAPSSVFVDAGSGPDLRLAAIFSERAALSVGIDLDPGIRQPPGIDTIGTVDKRGDTAGRRALGVVADLAALPLADRSVDVIALRSVVEHLADPVAVLSGFARSLKPGGWVVALTPSRWYYASVIGRLMPKRLAHATLEFIYGPTVYDNFPTFYRANTPRAMARAARGAGLTLEEARVCPHPPDYLKFSPTMFRLGVLLDRITLSMRPLHLLQPSFLFVMRKP